MKLNFVKFFDRLAIVLALPFAVLGFFYAQEVYIPENTVKVYFLENDRPHAEVIYNDMVAKGEDLYSPSPYKGALAKGNPLSPYMRLIGNPSRGGVLANGKTELTQTAKDFPIMKIALERAYSQGGDNNGILVNCKEFGYGSTDELGLLPSIWKRILYTFASISVFSGGIIILSCALTRTVRWIFRGLI